MNKSKEAAEDRIEWKGRAEAAEARVGELERERDAEIERLKDEFRKALCPRCDMGGDDEECNCLVPKLEAAEARVAGLERERDAACEAVGAIGAAATEAEDRMYGRFRQAEIERDEARAKVAELEQETLAAKGEAYRLGYDTARERADRLAEAMRNLKTLALESPDPGIDGTWVRHEDLLDALAAYREGEK
jgi:hypothetical protein